jgi:hypothetical protein
MLSAKKTVSYKELFNNFNVLPVASEYLLSLLSFVIQKTKISNTFRNTQPNVAHKHVVHVPNADLNSYPKGVYYAGTEVYDALQFTLRY